MDPILDIARRHDLPVIEDCAQAMGAKYKGQPVGSFGDLACFSFGDGKQIIGGDGGCVVTDNDLYYQRLVAIGSHTSRQERDISDPELTAYIDSLTYTFRMHPIAAVIVNTQLDFLEQWHRERRGNHHRLSSGLTGIPCIKPVAESDDVEHCFHIYGPSFVAAEAQGVNRETYVAAVEAEGAPFSLGYVRQPIYLRRRFQDRRYFYGRGLPWSMHPHSGNLYKDGDCPVAEKRCAETELQVKWSSSLRGDQSTLIDQYLEAFRKVAENLDELRGLAGAAGGRGLATIPPVVRGVIWLRHAPELVCKTAAQRLDDVTQVAPNAPDHAASPWPEVGWLERVIPASHRKTALQAVRAFL